MRKIILVFSIFISLILGAVGYATTEKLVNAYQVDYEISINGGKYLNNSDLEYPLLSYKDRTYISIRDIAKQFNSNVYWSEENKSIRLIENYNEPIINESETALLISKAIINEKYRTKVNEKTQYLITQFMLDHSSSNNNMFEIFVIFDFDERLEKNQEYINHNSKFLEDISDVKIWLNARSGEISIQEL